MPKLLRVGLRGKRLKGLDEVQPPAFGRRMGRVERRWKWTWYAMLVGAITFGLGLGLFVL